MPVWKWSPTPRNVAALFLLATAVPAAGLAWLSWRVIQQDRAVEEQQILQRCEIAADGETELAKAREQVYDLILLDVMLPRKDGFQVCRDLRRTGITTPIIMLTAKTQEAEKVLGLQLGADDYVTKPFSPLELCARIQAVLRRSASAAPVTYRFGELEADFVRSELHRGGKLIDLTPLEFKMLAAFVRNRGRVLSRQQLIDLAWSPNTFCTDRVVDTHVFNLRRKIESDPSHPRYLVGIRGTGYRFDG